MLRSETLRVGSAYVNARGSLVREIVEDLDRFRVRFNEFDLNTGRLIAPPLRVSYKRPFARWARREATINELGRLHPGSQRVLVQSARSTETQTLERQHVRARVEQVVHSNVMHRW